MFVHEHASLFFICILIAIFFFPFLLVYAFFLFFSLHMQFNCFFMWRVFFCALVRTFSYFFFGYLYRARKALETFEKHTKSGLIESITSQEESHTYNSAWAQLPASFRNAVKMSFLYAARFRHVVLVTQQTELQQLAKSQQLLALDLMAFGDFVTKIIAQQYAQPTTASSASSAQK